MIEIVENKNAYSTVLMAIGTEANRTEFVIPVVVLEGKYYV